MYRMLSKPWLALLLLGLFLLSPAWGQQLDLYGGQAVVPDEGPEARAQGLREILRSVVIKLTGSRSVREAPALDSVLQQAPSLVQQFRYRRSSGSSSGAGEVLVLQARFDPQALNRLLESKGIATWRGRRPRVLLWLAEQQGVRRVLLDPSEDPAVAGVLRETATARGIPLELPLLDLQDQSAISAADLWADYGAAIREASARYSHDLILVGRLRRFDDGRWSADWSLWKGDSATTFSVQGEDRASVLRAGLEAAQERLSAQYRSRSTVAANAVLVRIESVDSLSAYGRIRQWLQQAATLRGVRLRAADGLAIVLALPGEDPAGMLADLDESLLLRRLPDHGEPSGDSKGLETDPVVRTYTYAGGT